MNTSTCSLRILEAPLLIPGNVKGESIGNYEQYLIEVLNASSWMKQHHKAPFRAQIIQDSGQCDSYSDQYGLDFKLIASESAMQATSMQIPEKRCAYSGRTVHPFRLKRYRDMKRPLVCFSS